ncbi:hypothetical protein ACFT8W_17180 [Streptomyces hygroscopicus]|uniref:hypothetical protein n=1 Tax=Streptomyces hygroscopicus TaxID=1912 RepID=UPI00363267AD
MTLDSGRQSVNASVAAHDFASATMPQHLPRRADRVQHVAEGTSCQVTVSACHQRRGSDRIRCERGDRDVTAVMLAESNSLCGAGRFRLVAGGSVHSSGLNPKHRSAHRYSLRGISVCEEWMDFAIFRDWALANGYMDGKEIDRIDNNLGYNPENCRWVTKLENLDNRAKYLPADLEEWLHAHVRRAGASPYEVIKSALEGYLGVSRTGD